MSNYVTIVSGIPRSGTSMMMQMLDAGGADCMHDRVRSADENNPAGYYELEAVKDLRTDTSWLAGCKGKVVKIILQLLPYLPNDFEYRIILMRRSLSEILSSQNRMVSRLKGEADNIPNERLEAIYARQLASIRDDLCSQGIPNMDVDYRQVIETPLGTAGTVNDFLGRHLDVESMAHAVHRELYREREQLQPLTSTTL